MSEEAESPMHAHRIKVRGAIYCTTSPLPSDVQASLEAAIEHAICEAVNESSHGSFTGSVEITEPETF